MAKARGGLPRLLKALARKLFEWDYGDHPESWSAATCSAGLSSSAIIVFSEPIGRFTYTQEVFLNLALRQLRIAEPPVGSVAEFSNAIEGTGLPSGEARDSPAEWLVSPSPPGEEP